LDQCSDNKQKPPIAEFTAISVAAWGIPSHVISKALFELHARCENGYLAIAAISTLPISAYLVDLQESLGVSCSRPLHRPTGALRAENPGQTKPEAA